MLLGLGQTESAERDGRDGGHSLGPDDFESSGAAGREAAGAERSQSAPSESCLDGEDALAGSRRAAPPVHAVSAERGDSRGARSAEGCATGHAAAARTEHSGAAADRGDDSQSSRSSTPAQPAQRGGKQGHDDGRAKADAESVGVLRPEQTALGDDPGDGAGAAANPLLSGTAARAEEGVQRPSLARRWLHMTDEGTAAGLSGEDVQLESAARELQSSILSFLADAESAPPPCQTPVRFGAGSNLPTPVRAPTAGSLSDRSTLPTTPGESPCRGPLSICRGPSTRGFMSARKLRLDTEAPSSCREGGTSCDGRQRERGERGGGGEERERERVAAVGCRSAH
jgi:hypothetical protein